MTARPSWVSGAARLVDLGGVFDRYAFRISSVPTAAEAIAGDWFRVGADLSQAMRASGEPHKNK